MRNDVSKTQKSVKLEKETGLEANHSFTHSFIPQLFIQHTFVGETVLNSRDPSVNRTNKKSCFLGAYVLIERGKINK